MAHSIQGVNCIDWSSDKLIKMILAGADNIRATNQTNTSTRRAMNIDTLLILGHRIAESTWTDTSKQVVWAACTTAFFTSVRMGEILAQTENMHDKHATLLWKNVRIMSNNEILLYLPCTKTKKLEGEFIDIFPVTELPCCPVAALKRLASNKCASGSYNLGSPVFQFESGKNLTTNKLNQILKDMLQDIYVPGENSISCHSFRAAIPTAINLYPDRTFVSDVKEWGSWKGESYLKYIRQPKEQRKLLFEKVKTVLFSNTDVQYLK